MLFVHDGTKMVRGEISESVLSNFDELLELWDWFLNNLTYTEMKSRA